KILLFTQEKSRSTCSSVFSTSATTKQTTRSTTNESKCSRSSKGSKESSRSSVASQGSKENRDLHRMIEQEQLRKSLENLVRYFAHRADESDDREWSMITGVAERLLLDVTDCIRKEKPLNHDLLARIRDLNKLARQATLQSGGDQKKKSEVSCLVFHRYEIALEENHKLTLRHPVKDAEVPGRKVFWDGLIHSCKWKRIDE
ncbi:hypothetical protein COOONC_12678, partial [Cooperia oncophora]